MLYSPPVRARSCCSPVGRISSRHGAPLSSPTSGLWYDGEGADPSKELQAILEEEKLARSRIGIELRTFGLTADKYDLVRRRLDGWCELVDASHLVRNLRMVKSPAEIAYVRKAAELADRSLEAMLAAASPRRVRGRHCRRGCGTHPCREAAILRHRDPMLAPGDRRPLVRSATGFRHLDPVDPADDGVRRQLSALLRLPDAHHRGR